MVFEKEGGLPIFAGNDAEGVDCHREDFLKIRDDPEIFKKNSMFHVKHSDLSFLWQGFGNVPRETKRIK